MRRVPVVMDSIARSTPPDMSARSFLPLTPKPRRRSRQDRSRDTLTLGRLSRPGELTSVWVPDEAHEAMRDLVRVHEAATKICCRRTPGGS